MYHIVPCNGILAPYSARNAVIGSIREARFAGIQHERIATAKSRSDTLARTQGSVAFTS
jgi:hypothetical protein